MINIKRGVLSNAIALLCNLLLVYVVYMLCRIEYVLENWDVYANTLMNNSWVDLLKGSLIFDTSAILYTNSLYALMMLLPVVWAHKKTWRKVAKCVFVVVNGLCVVMNLGDSVYFKYTGRRTTTSVFQEFENEGNLGSIMMNEVVNHWYLVLLGMVLIAILWLVYANPTGSVMLRKPRQYVVFCVTTVLCLVLYVPLTVCGMRGGATTAVRPITISNANQYVNHPQEAAAILNTPFAMIRTVGKTSFSVPQYMPDDEMDHLYSPLHRNIAENTDSIGGMSYKNVVILIVESFGREYIGAYNEGLDNGEYKGYTPFIDSLYNYCLSFDYTFANGRKSIDGMPSILSSIPMFVEPFFLTPASMNEVSGVAEELGKVGYESAFFHGAENGSMGFQAFARTTGFQKYFGRTEYDNDERTGGEKDFDGTWAIWDEPFLQYYAMKMSEMKEPFVTAVFTASSHHPFAVPEEYKNVYRDEDDNPIHKCIRYTDMALRRFFETASRQPWYENTLFVMTSDHTNMSSRAEYQTDLGLYGAPILFFDPSGRLEAGRRHCIAQQIDIMPTVLSYVGYNGPYVAFGSDLLTTPDEETWAVNYNSGIYQYVTGDYLLQFDGQQVKALYNYKTDWMMSKNLVDEKRDIADGMTQRLKAVIQSYMGRMNEDRLTK